MEVFEFTLQDTARIIEAYVGEYASGKSELAINRAFELKKLGRSVTLVDLDTVEPFYTLRPLKEFLEEKGIHVIGYSKQDSFGFGETGAMFNPRAKWVLLNNGDIILDIGYGVFGARTLNLVEGANESPELKIMAVVNATRPITNSKERIVEYLRDLGRVDGIIANTHLGEQTTSEIISEGNQIIMEAALELNLPVEYMAIDSKFKKLTSHLDFLPIKYIDRYMPAAIW